MEYFFNEESAFCCLPSNFTDYHVSLMNSDESVTPEQIKQAEEVLEKARQQKVEQQYQDFASAKT
jgi:hypothetical protein